MRAEDKCADSGIELRELQPLRNANLDKVMWDPWRLKPQCRIHGPMMRLTEDSIYRCVVSYSVNRGDTRHKPPDQDFLKENDCDAGCVLVES